MSRALPFRSHTRRLVSLLGVRFSSTRHHQGHVVRRLSSLAAAPYGEHHSRHHQQQSGEEGNRAVKVTVWWDFQMCGLPPGVNPFHVGPRVTEALRRAGIRGPVDITAFGDVTLLARAEQMAYAATGVTLTHVPATCGKKDGWDRSFMADLMYWIAQNPPPAHFFLISGDKDLANVLHRLRMSNYNVLIACPEVGSKMLRTVATLMWPWETLIRGVDLSPKYLNQPPDGLSCSWYGHYKETDDNLLKPKDLNLMKPKDPNVVKPKDPIPLPQSTKVPKAPKSMINGIKKVLHFYPEGVNIRKLRAELRRINVEVYGFRKFRALLREMSDDVKFIDPLPGDNNPAVVLINKIPVESSNQSFNQMDSAQSVTEADSHSETKSEELSSGDDQSSLSELLSFTEQRTLEADVPLSLSDKLSRDQRKAPHITTTAGPPWSRVEAGVTMAADVPSPPSNASSQDNRNDPTGDHVTQTEPHVSHTEADMVGAADTPYSGEHCNIGRKGLVERIKAIWYGKKPIVP